MKHYLPQPIRYRRPPFLLRVHPGASAVPSIALACREYAPMTQATSFPPSTLQTWQHVADLVGRLYGSHSNRHRFGRAIRGGGWMVEPDRMRKSRENRSLRVIHGRLE